VNWIAIAAFTAAGLSLVNVAVSGRLTSRGHLEQWRREQEQPIVARILTLSSDALREWRDTAMAKEQWSGIFRDPGKREDAEALQAEVLAHHSKGRELWNSLRYEAAQLDLLASPGVRKAARDLVAAHEGAWFRMNPAGAGMTPFRTGEEDKIDKLHGKLVERTRADFGVDRVPVGRRLPRLFVPRPPRG
jgi:hypothetical protein